MKKMRVLVAVVCMSLPTTAFALDLSAARAAGAVCEQSDGYIRAVKPGADVKALVAEVNARRKVAYEETAKKNNQSVSVVGQLATPQILTSSGAKVCQ